MKILITGATGFIGNHTTLALLARGHEVIATSRHKPRQENSRWLTEVEFIPCDLHHPDSASALLANGMPDVMVHLAWQGLPNFHDDFHLQQNLPADMHLLTAMLNAGLPHLLVTGTCFEYGMQEGCLSEKSAAQPNNPYALAKHKLHLALQKKKPRATVLQWVRIFYLYGEGQASHILMAQLDTAITNGDEVFNMSPGDQQRDYLPVTEVARRLALLVEHPEVHGTINCCSGKPVTVHSLVERHIAKRGASIRLNRGHYPYPTHEPMSFWGDSAKLDKIINPD